ncbi:type VII secretion-associated protein [Corynebacterium cystitidis]|uniref:type VII secretion-associated protein n=1 Tax=Corynebacterium cystitidis TaxID=35757 RepID=UPI00211E42EE|nr:type VII secretion-associated protein [Corynebacterium cystitidis]
MTTPTTLTITVSPSVTIIDADTTYFRYDNPGPAELVGYCLQLIDDDPAGYTIVIDAAKDFASEVKSSAEKKGFAVRAVARDDDTPGTSMPPPAEAQSPEHQAVESIEAVGHMEPPLYPYEDVPGEITGLIRPVEEQKSSARSRVPVLILGATVAIVLGAGIWAVGMSTQAAPPAIQAEEPPAVENSVENSAEPVSEASRSAAPITSSPAVSAPETVVLAQNGLEVTLPAGFHLEADDDMWKAEGDDPDFRLQLAIDDLYGLPAEELLKQVEREVSMDPELELVAVDDRHIEYHQYAVDGSEAQWVTWVEAGVQLSVGCHSRYSPTTVQRATCQMAYESALYTAPDAEL